MGISPNYSFSISDDSLHDNDINSQTNNDNLQTNDVNSAKTDVDNIDDVNIDDIINKYQSYPSITKIKENVKLDSKFQFYDVTVDEIYKEINALDHKKESVENDIPGKIMMECNDIASPVIK